MQKTFITLSLIAGVLLFPSSPVVAESEIDLPYFAGDSSSVDPTEGNLVIFNASRGFFPLPLSENGIPTGMSSTDNPTLSLADTIALSDGTEDARGLVVYRATDGMLFVNTFVGNGNESAHSASYFGEGDFVMVMTARPDECATLNLTECHAHSGFLEEKFFSISLDGTALAPIVVEEDPVTNSITSDLSDGETVIAHIDGVQVPETTTEIVGTASSTPLDMIASVIEAVSLPDYTEKNTEAPDPMTNTEDEPVEAPSLEGDLDTAEIITSEF